MLDLSKGKKRQKRGNLPILEKDSLWKDLEETRFRFSFSIFIKPFFSLFVYYGNSIYICLYRYRRNNVNRVRSSIMSSYTYVSCIFTRE